MDKQKHTTRLVNGLDLPRDIQQEVLAAWVYRWTFDNPHRIKAYAGIEHPRIPLISDEQWLLEHNFYVTQKGKIDRRRRYAVSRDCSIL